MAREDEGDGWGQKACRKALVRIGLQPLDPAGRRLLGTTVALDDNCSGRPARDRCEEDDATARLFRSARRTLSTRSPGGRRIMVRRHPTASDRSIVPAASEAPFVPGPVSPGSVSRTRPSVRPRIARPTRVLHLQRARPSEQYGSPVAPPVQALRRAAFPVLWTSAPGLARQSGGRHCDPRWRVEASACAHARCRASRRSRVRRANGARRGGRIGCREVRGRRGADRRGTPAYGGIGRPGAER